MKSNIKYFLVLPLFVFSSYSSSHTPVARLSPNQTLVYLQGTALKGVGFSNGKSFFLRQQFLSGQGKAEHIANTWSLSSSGTTLAFVCTPSDIDFFSARAYREYLFAVPFDGKPKVILAAYGPKADKEDFTFASPSWSKDGKQIIVSRQIVGNSTKPSEVAIYDVNTRREIWSSRLLASRLFPLKEDEGIPVFDSLRSPSLSPDGNDLVCLACEEAEDGGETSPGSEQNPPPAHLVHFDLKHNRAEILASVDNTTPQFAWHPTQKRFIYVATNPDLKATNNLFNFDLQTHTTTRFAPSQQNDFSPQWSPDGKQLFWIRGGSQSGRVYCANADGSNDQAILPQISAVTQIQIVAKTADWSRYSKLNVEPLAGTDK